MSSIEERLVRDITAVKEGVTVSESDLLDARSAVDEHVKSQHRRSRRRAVAAAVATAATVAVVGVATFQTLGDADEASQPAGPAPTVDPDAAFLKGALPTPELMDGFWRLDDGAVSVSFDQDGTARFDDRGSLFSNPQFSGDYELVGDWITVTVTRGAPRCVGEQLTMRAAFPSAGSMRLVVDPGSDTSCAPLPPGQQVLEHVLPTSKSMASWIFSTESGWRPLTSEAVLEGDWMAEGGGYLIEMAPSGIYYIFDEKTGLTDQGEWALNDSDLTLTSSSRSATCNPGDQLVLRGMEKVNPGTLSIRGTVAENTCGGAWTPEAWVLVPNTTLKEY